MIHLHIDFGTGLERYLDTYDHDEAMTYLRQRGYADIPADRDERRGMTEREIYDHITEVAERVINEAYPDIDITVDWVTFENASLPWEQDTIEQENDEMLAELQESLALIVERVLNHEYEQIG